MDTGDGRYQLLDGSVSDVRQLHRIRFRAMGCEMGAWVLAEDRALAATRLDIVRTWMALADSVLSRFQLSSELSRLNMTPGVPKEVSPLLWDALDWALYAADATDGRCNPALLPALVAAGYDRDFDALREAVPDANAATAWSVPATDLGLVNAAWEMIQRNGMHRTVQLPPGMQLDLGGTAKGWAAARAADMLAPVGPCLVDAGGDLAVRGGLPGIQGWPIGVAHPLASGRRLATLVLRDRGVATSGVDYRRWYHGGAERHHLIDPATLRPAETDLLTATIVAPDVAWADVQALVVMVLGREDGLAWLLDHAELEGLLVDREGHIWSTPGLPPYAYDHLPVTTLAEMSL